MMENTLSFFNDYTLCMVIIGTTILGITAGILGCFAFLRQQSLLGDAISHASLPGIATMFLLTHSKSQCVLLLGGTITGAIGTILVKIITHKTSIKNDTALGIVLSVFFGLGLILLTFIQKKAIAHQAILNKFLFGNASTLMFNDICFMASIGFLVLSCVVLFWKEFKLLSFDPSYAQSLGYSIIILDGFLTTLLVLSIVLGLQTVGVVLMSAMFIAPAAAARQWTLHLSSMVLLSAIFGAISGIVGACISSSIEHMPTGPIIVVVMSSIVIISVLFAPHRGIVWHLIKKRIFFKQHYE